MHYIYINIIAMSDDATLKIRTLNNIINTRTQRLSEVQTKCDRCQSMIDALEAQIALNPPNVAELQAECDCHCIRRDKLADKVSNLNTIISGINSQIAALSP